MCAQYAFPERSWYRGPVAHNCVVVDEQRYGDCCGECVAFMPDGPIQLVVTEMDTAYKGVTMRRIEALGDGFLLDVYHVDGGSIHDWVFHSIGDLSVSVPLQLGPRPGGDWKKLQKTVRGNIHFHGDLTNGYEYLNDVKHGHRNGLWTAIWKIKAGALRMTMAAGTGTEIMSASGPGYWKGPDVPLVIARRRETESLYAAVFESIPGSEKRRQAAEIEVETTNGLTIVRARGKWGAVELIENGRARAKCGDIISDAKLFVVLRDAPKSTAQAVVVHNGSFIEIDGQRIGMSKGETRSFVRRAGKWMGAKP